MTKAAQHVIALEQSNSDKPEIIRRWFLGCTVFSAPFVFVLPGIGDRNVAIAASDLFIVAGCIVLLQNLSSGRLRVPLAMLCYLNIGALLLTQCINSNYLLMARGPTVAIMEIPKALLLWLHFYVLVNLIQTKQHLLLAIRMWIAAGIVVALLGIGGSLAFQLFGIENGYSNNFRAEGTLGDANLFAAHLGVSFILLLFYCRLINRFEKWVIPVLLIFGLGILLSASRGSTLSFVICLGLLWMSASSWRIRLATVGAFSLLALVLIVNPPQLTDVSSNPIVDRFSTVTFSLENEGAADRKGLWESAWVEFLASPLVGIGRSGFTPLDQPGLSKPSAIHNTYLSIACETGLVGFLLQMGFFLYNPLRLLREPLRNASQQVTRRILVLALTLIGLCGATISIENYRGLWMLLGLMETYQRLHITYASPAVEA
jgi:O-antigen ligase